MEGVRREERREWKERKKEGKAAVYWCIKYRSSVVGAHILKRECEEHMW